MSKLITEIILFAFVLRGYKFIPHLCEINSNICAPSNQTIPETESFRKNKKITLTCNSSIEKPGYRCFTHFPPCVTYLVRM